MNAEEVLAVFRETGGLLEGHFIYTSGRHGRQFLQAARVLQHPAHTEKLCAALGSRFRDQHIDLVVGPATGGITLAHETARGLGCRMAYSEKDGESGMAVKRGFTVGQGDRVLVVEDIITTGGSVKKTIAHLRDRGADVRGVGALIDRSSGEAAFDCVFEALASVSMESWQPAGCPLCAEGVVLREPDDIIVY
jgi:orotate phosphoribosyltransferase